MKYKVCDKCGEFVTKTGIISSLPNSSNNTGRFAKCNNKECNEHFSKSRYEKLNDKEF